MSLHSGLNFLPQRNRLRLLQAGALSAVLMAVVMAGAVLRSSGGQTASLSDTLATPSVSTSTSEHISARPKAISENAAVSVALGKESDTAKYYERETGKAFSVNLKTLKTDVLSDTRLPGFIRSYWLPYSNKVVSEFQDPGGISYRAFDYQTKATTTIGSDIIALAVSPDGRQIAYMKPMEDASALFISDSDGSNPRTLITTRAQEVRLNWPVKDTLSMASRRPDRTGTDLSIIDLDGTLTIMMSNRENLEYVWSPDGTHLLYSYFTPEQGVSLWYREAGSRLDVPLGLATSARKCAWHDNTMTITCGVPAKNSLGRDVPADRSATVDDIATLDMSTGEQSRLYGGTGATLIGVIEPLVSSSGNYFVFTNLFDQRLYLFPL
ncbi:MAG: hypothetical protein AAB375_01570 [Patescibacteria group bacterium]